MVIIAKLNVKNTKSEILCGQWLIALPILNVYYVYFMLYGNIPKL